MKTGKAHDVPSRETALACLAHIVGNSAANSTDRSDRIGLRSPIMIKWAEYVTGGEPVVASIADIIDLPRIKLGVRRGIVRRYTRFTALRAGASRRVHTAKAAFPIWNTVVGPAPVTAA